MKERYIVIFAVISLIMVVVDLYTFKGLRLLTADISNPGYRNFIHYSYWVISLCFMATIPYVFLNLDKMVDPKNNSWVFLLNSVFLMMLLSKLSFVLFHGLDDLFHVSRKGGSFLMSLFSPPSDLPGEPITRAKFFTYMGVAFFSISFSSIAYGIVKGRFNFRVIRKKLGFDNLPEAFNGLKVVQISDIHIGSFPKRHKSVEEAVQMVNALEPDIILFTGDLVNNVAEEMDGWVPVFRKLEAKIGKYSILGNHDYGDYHTWGSEHDKARNLEKLKNIHSQMGFDLLLNENRTIEKGGGQISLLGVENWGKPPFVQYGDVDKASTDVDRSSFKMLMSHDPSHWDEKVLGKTNIDLTLSGHTHGMQFGIETPRFKWSPVKFKYPRWAGLYTEGKQHLYVNRGFGHIGFAGRVGMAPEITLLELERNQAA